MTNYLTEAEILALETLKDFSRILLYTVLEKGENHDADGAEAVSHIRALQNIIGANAGARAEPDHIRLMGLSFQESRADIEGVPGDVWPAPTFDDFPYGPEYEAAVRDELRRRAPRVKPIACRHPLEKAEIWRGDSWGPADEVLGT